MKKKILIITVVILAIMISFFTIVKLSDNKFSGEFKYNETNKEYTFKKIKIMNDLELSYDVSKKTYKITGTIKNEGNVKYKNLKIYLELYDINGDKIDDYIIKIDNIETKENKKIDYEFKDIDTLVYNHKINKIEGEVK